jgi:hypothetical protein
LRCRAAGAMPRGVRLGASARAGARAGRTAAGEGGQELGVGRSAWDRVQTRRGVGVVTSGEIFTSSDHTRTGNRFHRPSRAGSRAAAARRVAGPGRIRRPLAPAAGTQADPLTSRSSSLCEGSGPGATGGRSVTPSRPGVCETALGPPRDRAARGHGRSRSAPAPAGVPVLPWTGRRRGGTQALPAGRWTGVRQTWARGETAPSRRARADLRNRGRCGCSDPGAPAAGVVAGAATVASPSVANSRAASTTPRTIALRGERLRLAVRGGNMCSSD